MENTQQFYIDGEWVDPIGTDTLDVVNPATEETVATIALGDEKDVDRAVTAPAKPSTVMGRRHVPTGLHYWIR